MQITDYITQVKNTYENGQATEHSHRGFLRDSLAEFSGCTVTNEPKRQKCGATDYIIKKNTFL